MIKIDMNMPDCCMKCPFYIGYNAGTCLADQDRELWLGGIYAEMERHRCCPLEEVEDND